MKRLGLALLSTLLLAACGGNGDEAQTVTETLAGQPTEETTAPEPSTEASGTTDSGDESVEDFALRVVEMWNRGQWGRAYQELHPAQQRIMSPEQFADCVDEAAASSVPGADLTVTDVYDEDWTIPGTEESVPSKAVTVTQVFRYEEEGSTVEQEGESSTMHVFDTDEGWTWIVNEDVIEYFRDDLC